ncbi:MAG: hypothetical protein DHS20C10_06260 [marine bacterium B5-7]|nr:MAG: hypothetical protein DHS20C10_06260 [marine bacterium B5-7]
MLKWLLSFTESGWHETSPTEAAGRLNKKLYDAYAQDWPAYRDSLKAGASILYKPRPTSESLFGVLCLNPNISKGMMILTVAFAQNIHELAFKNIGKTNPPNKKILIPIIEKRKQYQDLLRTIKECEQNFLGKTTNEELKITLAKHYLQAAHYWMDLARVMLTDMSSASKSSGPSEISQFSYESFLQEMMFFARKAFRIAIYAEKGLMEIESQGTSLTHYYPNAPETFQQYFDEEFRSQYLQFNLVAGLDDRITEKIAFAEHPSRDKILLGCKPT